MAESLDRSDVRLLALDLDGTLIDHDLRLSPRLRRAVAAAMAAGVTVTLATGRMVRETLPYATQLGLTAPLVCHQGALITHGTEVLYHQTLPQALATPVLSFAQERGIHVNTYIGDSLFVREMTRAAENYERYSPGIEIQVVGDLLPFMADKEATKLLLIDKEEAVDAWWPTARRRWSESMQVVRSHANLVEFTHPETSKGVALDFLSRRMNIAREAVMAIGDNHNDVSMIRWAGIGVAMGGGYPDVLAVADYVAPPFVEDGAAEAIERFVLGESAVA